MSASIQLTLGTGPVVIVPVDNIRGIKDMDRHREVHLIGSSRPWFVRESLDEVQRLIESATGASQ